MHVHYPPHLEKQNIFNAFETPLCLSVVMYLPWNVTTNLNYMFIIFSTLVMYVSLNNAFWIFGYWSKCNNTYFIHSSVCFYDSSLSMWKDVVCLFPCCIAFYSLNVIYLSIFLLVDIWIWLFGNTKSAATVSHMSPGVCVCVHQSV